MSDYIPTTALVRHNWGAYGAPQEEFDRWLAYHDAQKRAEWEAEQGEAERDTITIKRPVVPYGPHHMTENQGTAHYMREVIRKIESGRITVGGSNVTRTVKDLLAHVAMTLDRLPVEENGENDERL